MALTTSEARAQYEYALKKGKKQRFKDRLNRKKQTLEVLDDIVDIYKCKQEDLGEIEVPAFLIVGTKSASRAISFSSNFMPLLKQDTEFGIKWINVCNYHLSDSGINESPKVYEYFGKFYVEEGNKRVSVLKSYGAVTIPCRVIRVLPLESCSKEAKLYLEFLDYYKLSRLYSIQFKKLGNYSKLISLMGLDDKYVWERKQRYEIIGLYERLRECLNSKHINCNHQDALIIMMEIYGYQELLTMKDSDLIKAILHSKVKIENDISFYKIMCIADEEDNQLKGNNGTSYFKNVHFTLSAGDLKAEYLEYIMNMSNRPLFYVHGNHDEHLDDKDFGGTCLDDDVVVYRGLRILGLGGSYKYKDNAQYMYTERQMKRRIQKVRRKINKVHGVDIIVTHAPIKGFGDLNDYAHQGFECFRDLIDEYHPKYFIYGHVHSRYSYSHAKSFKYEDTEIINATEKTIITI